VAGTIGIATVVAAIGVAGGTTATTVAGPVSVAIAACRRRRAANRKKRCGDCRSDTYEPAHGGSPFPAGPTPQRGRRQGSLSGIHGLPVPPLQGAHFRSIRAVATRLRG